MGWGAAYALAEEWSDWCDGPEEAYEILYGPEDRDRGEGKPRCPICNKRLKSVDGVIQHMQVIHKRRKHQRTLAAFKEMYGRD